MDSNTAIELMQIVGIIVGGPACVLFGIFCIGEFVEACERWFRSYQIRKAKR